MGSCETEPVLKAEELGLESPSLPSTPLPPPAAAESLLEEFGNLRLEEKIDEEKGKLEEDDTDAAAFKEEDESTGRKDDACLLMSEEKLEGGGGGHHENTGWEDSADPEKHSASFKDEKGEGFHYPEKPNESTGWKVDANLNKDGGGGDNEKTGWEKDDTDLDKGSACFKEEEEEKGEWVHYPQRPDANTGWEVDANFYQYKGGGANEKTGWEEDDADLAKGSACFKEEEKGAWVHYPPRPYANTGWDNGANVEKLEERFEVGGDNGNKHWEDDACLQKGKWFEYPQRPGNPDCSYYMRTGNCQYGSNCKFNHPPNKRRNQAKTWDTLGLIQAAGQTIKEVPERVWQKECKFYLMPGGCKFGRTCKYGLHGHDREKTKIGLVELNFSGLPLRPGEKECPFYMRTGHCKFSSNCRFHHPDPTFVAEQDPPPSGYENGGSHKQLASGASQLPEVFLDSRPFQKNSNEPVSFPNAPHGFFTAMMFPPKGLRPTSDRNSYQASVDPIFSTERNIYPSASTLNGPTPKAGGPNSPMHQPAQTEDYLERPGQTDCPYIVRYGNCEFGSACMFHHPSALTSNGSTTPKADSVLHQQAQMRVYPHRPTEPLCPFFMKHGDCKFKSACKFHHPSALTLNGPTTRTDAPPVHLQAQMDEYPQRPGEPECPYFMRHRSCKFGSSCRFHHPSAPTPTLNGPTRRADGPVHHRERMEEYPERPGEPECSFYMRVGHCKFRFSCRFHHPKTHLPREPPCIISPIGLPLRPDQPICSYYSRFGICKFGPSCRFDHPVDHGTFSSEAVRMPDQVSSPDEIRTEEDQTAGSSALEQEAEW